MALQYESVLERLQANLPELRKRTGDLYGIQIPTVRDIDEAALLCNEFEAVITSGPDAIEVMWRHPNHRVWTFGDTVDPLRGPSRKQVLEMVEWGAQQGDLLVHCHAGMSRSTATAWGIAIARGADPEEALRLLQSKQPMDNGVRRLFIPNNLIVSHLEEIFDDRTLSEIREKVVLEDQSDSLDWYVANGHLYK